MANRYWNPSGNTTWADANAWAATDGGATGESVPGTGDDVFFTSTNVSNCTLGASASCLSIDFSGGTGYTGTFNHSTLTLRVNGDLTYFSGMTRSGTGAVEMRGSSGTKTIYSDGIAFTGILNLWGGATFQLLDGLILASGFTRTSGSFDANGQTVTFTSSANSQISVDFTGSNAFYNLVRTGAANKTSRLSLFGDITVTNNLTVSGNSAINRLIVDSDTLGTTRTITCNGTVTASNVDFKDITGAGSADWDLSAITGLSGDCGGNSGITFTSPSTQDCSAGTTWSTATWTSRVPLPQDTATFSGSSRTITQDMPRIGSVNFTGSSGLTWTTSTACSVFGSINLTDLGTLTDSSQTYTFEGRSTYTLTTAGKTWGKAITLNAPSGTLTITDDLIMGAARALTITSGAFSAVNGATNSNVTCGSVSSSNSNVRSITMGSGTWTLMLNANPWTTTTTTNLTFSAGTSTIKLDVIITADRTFSGGGLTFHNFWNATSGAYAIIVNGSNTFNDFKIDAGRTVKFTNSTTTTVTTFTASGTVGNLITLRNSSSTTTATLAKAGGGVIDVDYLDIDYIIGSPEDTWYVGENSVDGGNNTNIYFEAAPSGANIAPIINTLRRRYA